MAIPWTEKRIVVDHNAMYSVVIDEGRVDFIKPPSHSTLALYDPAWVNANTETDVVGIKTMQDLYDWLDDEGYDQISIFTAEEGVFDTDCVHVYRRSGPERCTHPDGRLIIVHVESYVAFVVECQSYREYMAAIPIYLNHLQTRQSLHRYHNDYYE